MAGSKLTALVDLAGGQVPTDLAYIVDVSAGVNGSKKSTLNDLFEQITKNVADGVIKGLDGAGTDGAGGDFSLSGGRGTGAGIPGLPVVRYPLTHASDAVLQSLSAASFPHWVSMHVRHNGDITVANTTVETSILGASQNGSTKTIEAGLARVGREFFLRLYGLITGTGTPTIRVRVRLGSVLIADTAAVALVNNTNAGNGGFLIECLCNVRTTGATGVLQMPFFRASYSATQGGALNQLTSGVTAQVIDFTVAQTFDVTVQFGTADPSNQVIIVGSSIEMSR